MAKNFVLVRQTKMRGVDLTRFDFDFDLTWMGFFLTADLKPLARYGGRDADSPEGCMSVAGLRYTASKALTWHRAGKAPPHLAPKTKFPRPEDYPTARRLTDEACIHCHQVNEIRRDYLQSQDAWDRAMLWVYPLPENVGLSLDPVEADRIAKVKPDSPAARAGLRADDRLVSVAGQTIASFGDVQYALHRTDGKRLPIVWTRDDKQHRAEVSLRKGWRETDLSWRWSMQYLEPTPWVYGQDLSPEKKKTLGLPEGALAFRQGAFLRPPAKHAGVRPGDIIIGIDGRSPKMTFRQFEVYVKLNYSIGDKVTYTVLRNGERIDVSMSLRPRPRPPLPTRN